MYKFICRWFARTFGPINQIENYMRNNVCFDKGSPSENMQIVRWVPDKEKNIEIIQYTTQESIDVEVYMNTKLVIWYNDLYDVLVSTSKFELEILYSNICPCFKN